MKDPYRCPMEIKLLAITPDAEKVIEKAGRTCYLSFDKMGEGTEKNFISFLIRSGHTSVLEHASATFRLSDISRSLTHQLVRHRIASFSQQSQRYVDEKNFRFVTPPSVEKDGEARSLYGKFMEEARSVYSRLRGMNILKEDARFVLPNAAATEIVLTANFREFRHIFRLRCEKKAQWEIRQACLMMLEILKEKAPLVFGDFVIDRDAGTASTEFPA